MLIVFLAVPSTLSSELAIISSPGYSNFVAFHCNDAVALKVDDSDDAIDSIFGKLGKNALKDCKDFVFDTSLQLLKPISVHSSHY